MKKKLLLLLPASLILFAFTLKDLQTDPWKAPDSAKSIKNPVEAGKQIVSGKKGKKVFQTNCIICHGETGVGNGPGGKSINPKPADLTSAKVQSQTDGEIFWKITNGRGPMIKWEPVIPEAQRWDLVNYIRSLKK
ncbi:MAG: cytochrome c class I [Flavobacteriales bacterium CG_4_9_14_3_um_filter_40_17]|nr:MAG: cytochrome c class I [Flavobacteriales bacterium CG_4_9_14_3_um_filter_40_17]